MWGVGNRIKTLIEVENKKLQFIRFKYLLNSLLLKSLQFFNRVEQNLSISELQHVIYYYIIL